MATLILPKVFINLLATGDYVAAYSNDRGRRMDLEGEVRTYGGGRRRSITREGRRNTMAVTLKHVTELEMVQLEGWIGLPVMYRDHRSARFVGVYLGLDYREYDDNIQRYDIGLTIQEETWIEGAA